MRYEDNNVKSDMTFTLDIELMIDNDGSWTAYRIYKNVIPLNSGPFNNLNLLDILRNDTILSKLIPIIDNALSEENRQSKFIWAYINLTEEEFLYLSLKYENIGSLLKK